MKWTNDYPTKPGYYWVYNERTCTKFLEGFFWSKDINNSQLIPTTMWVDYYNKNFNSDNVYLYGPIEEPDTPFQVENWYPNNPETHNVIKVPLYITKNFCKFVSDTLTRGHMGHTKTDSINYYIFNDYEDKYEKDPLKSGDYIVEEIDGYVRVYSESDFLNSYHKKE